MTCLININFSSIMAIINVLFIKRLTKIKIYNLIGNSIVGSDAGSINKNIWTVPGP